MTEEQSAPKTDLKLAGFRQRILEMVKHAEERFSLGVPYRAIAQKLAKTVKFSGYDLGTILEDMDKAGEVFLYTDEHYSRLVMMPEMREHYKLGIIGEETQETRNFIQGKWGRRSRGAQ